MAIELVTGYQGRDHVTADQWADFNRGIFGDAAILPVGNKMEVAIQTANKITVKDGIAVIDGRQVSIGYGESENITIKSGTQGKLRRDIVVLEYKRVEDTGVESVQFKVIDGTPATSNAQDPAVRNTDIRTGAIVSQKPFCRVRLNGTAIEGVDSLIRVKELKDMAFYEPVNNLVGTDPKMALAAPMGKELKKSIDQINTNLSKNLVYKHISDITINDQSNWTYGSATCSSVNGIGMIYGTVVRNSNNAPKWGELVGLFNNYSNKYDIQIPAFLTTGEIINMLVLRPNGELRCYPPDISKFTGHLGKSLDFNTTFRIVP